MVNSFCLAVENCMLFYCQQSEKKGVIMDNNKVCWCSDCNIPILGGKETCPLCGSKTKKNIASDLKPVFQQERLLLEYMLGKAPNSLADESVWANNNHYIISGQKLNISNDDIKNLDGKKFLSFVKKYKCEKGRFKEYIEKFCLANQRHIMDLTEEAADYIKKESAGLGKDEMYIAFSGGKDSTVLADLVINTLGSVPCLFADTTLEHPMTMEYIERMKKDDRYQLKIAKNTEMEFYDVAKKIGPPSQKMRWCCYMFKTGPVNRVLKEFFPNARLNFYGVRKSESVMRSRYNRTETDDKHLKIASVKVASPIFYWREIDIWLYILANRIDFNDAYRLGYKRVGCWCCPNSSARSDLMAKISIPKQYNRWHKFLVEFATSIGKENPENYINLGKWKIRQGGNGLPAANLVKLDTQVCATDENSMKFNLDRAINDKFITLFYPFGKVIDGNKSLGEKLVLDRASLQPYIKIEILSPVQVRISLLGAQDTRKLFREIKYQMVKYNACQGCLKCESLCTVGAISVRSGVYSIDENKCIGCKKCCTPRLLPGGCMMKRYLRTKGGRDDLL